MRNLKGISAVIATILMLVITIALAGTTYLYFTGIFTTQTQGIEITDAFCDSSGSVTIAIRNLGTSSITSMTCLRTSPSSGSCNPGFTGSNTPNIASGAVQNFPGVDTCQGSGSRFCQYRLTPNVGRTQPASVSCS